MKIGCLQFAPVKGDANANISSVDSILGKADPELDLLVLPELAFSGTGFKSTEEAHPFLEHTASGISTAWAKAAALKYDCTVVFGYPEKTQHTYGAAEIYNAMAAVSRDGEMLSHYRATQLQPGEEYWAQEGRDGLFGDWVPSLGQTAFGLSMDINSYKFREPWSKFGFAFHVLQIEANIAIVSMSWPTALSTESFAEAPFDPDMDTLTYWVSRLEPIIRADSKDEIIVVFSNRCGADDDVTYAGTSTVLGIFQGEVTIYGVLGRGESEILSVDTEKAPLGKLVYRPKTNMYEEREAQKAAFMARAKEARPPKSPNCYIQVTNPDRRWPSKAKSMVPSPSPPAVALETLAQTTYTPPNVTSPTSRRTPKLSLATNLDALKPRGKGASVHVATPINARPRGYSALAALERPQLQDLVEVETPVDSHTGQQRAHVQSAAQSVSTARRHRADSKPTPRRRNASPPHNPEYMGSLASPSLTQWGHESSRVSGSEAYSDVFDRDISFLSSATSLESSQLRASDGLARQPSPAQLDVLRGRTGSPRLVSRSSSSKTRTTTRSQSAVRRHAAAAAAAGNKYAVAAAAAESDIRETVLTTKPRQQDTLMINNNVIPIAASPSIWNGSTNATEKSFPARRTPESFVRPGRREGEGRREVEGQGRRETERQGREEPRDRRVEAQKSLRLQIGNMRARSASQTRAQAQQPIQRMNTSPRGVPASAHPNSSGHFVWPPVTGAQDRECDDEKQQRQQTNGPQGEWWVDQWMSREAGERRGKMEGRIKGRLGFGKYAPVTPKPMKLSFE